MQWKYEEAMIYIEVHYRALSVKIFLQVQFNGKTKLHGGA